MQACCTDHKEPVNQNKALDESIPTASDANDNVDGESVLSRTKPPPTRLSETDVSKLAEKFVQEKEFDSKDFDAKDYALRYVKFSSVSQEWSLYYVREPVNYPGDHFSIRIHDATGEMRFLGGM